ncbi:hypothetical protein ACI65C_004572 [Semiaphis heraclei]
MFFWNKIKSLKGLSRNNKINLYDKNTNELVNDSEQIPNELGEYFYKNSSNQNYTTQFSTFKQQCENETTINTVDENHTEQIQMNHPITSQEISHYITKSKNTPLIEQISYDDTKKYIKIITNDKWQHVWSKQNTKLNEIKGDTTQWYNPSLKRKEETVINRLRIGHTIVTHGFLMAKEKPPICTNCGTNLSVKHIISDCIKYIQERIKHGISHNLDAALGANHHLNADLINFLKQTNIYNQI